MRFVNVITSMFFFIVVIAFIGSVNATHSSIKHMPLLAVSEIDDEMIGNVADIYLETIPGSGRVFLDTFPLTKIDTQMSTRFAKEIACNYYDLECEKYDFIYTIRARSSIVGGPSAGSAIAILTAASILDLEINESVAITGTINSGAIIGTVSGIEAKIRAANKNNISKIIIPYGSKIPEEEDLIVEYLKNITLTIANESNSSPMIANESLKKKYKNYTELGEDIGIQVLDYSLLDDAMFEFTGFKKNGHASEIKISESYQKTMKKVAEGLCNRTFQLKNTVDKKLDITYDNATNLFDEFGNFSWVVDYIFANNMSVRSIEEMNNQNFYSAASYCFGSNVRYSSLIANFTLTNISNKIIVLEEKISQFKEEFNQKPIKTKTDLETFIIVNERISEAHDIIKLINTSDDYSNYGYALERFYSAISWSNFYGTGSEDLVIDKNSIRESCITKLREAEEVYNYANLLLPNYFDNIKKIIDDSYLELSNEQYDLCLFKASKAKAQSNAFLNAFNHDTSTTQDFIKIKQGVISQIIADQNSKGNFPIIGFSYYEYSKTLAISDPLSSLLYAEYALELSDLDMYFQKKKIGLSLGFDQSKLIIFFIGVFLGFMIFFVIFLIPKITVNKK